MMPRNFRIIFHALWAWCFFVASLGFTQEIVVPLNPDLLADEEVKPSSKQIHQCKPGPWGNLEYTYTYLEAPSRLMELINTPSAKTVWHLPGKNPTQLREFLLQSGMLEGNVELILQASLPYQGGPDYRLYPPSAVVESIPQSVRTKIYAILRQIPENTEHVNPVVIESGDVKDWFMGSSLEAGTIELIEKLSYPLGNSLVFSDTATVLSHIEDDVEERTFLKSLTRTRSLILNLKLAPNSEFEPLLDYWSAKGKNSDILPIFQSYTNLAGEKKLDVTNLLPPTPKKYLYTFPAFSLGVDGTFPDGLWASLNFFKYQPNEQFDDIETVIAYARQNYAPAEKPYRYGDILVISDPVAAEVVHACVYIADEIVYTKNGRSLLKPFMFMKIDDLLARYTFDLNPGIEMWRRIEP